MCILRCETRDPVVLLPDEIDGAPVTALGSTEKRIVTFNPKLAKKQIYEINKEVEKAKLLKASQAKCSEYGDSAKYVIFTTTGEQRISL